MARECERRSIEDNPVVNKKMLRGAMPVLASIMVMTTPDVRPGHEGQE